MGVASGEMRCKWCNGAIHQNRRLTWLHSEGKTAGSIYCPSGPTTKAEPAIAAVPESAIEPEPQRWSGSGNYVADREQAPQWVAFANGRTVGIAMPPDGEPYLVVGVEQPGERWLRAKAAEESDAGSIGVGGLAVDVGLYTRPSVVPGDKKISLTEAVRIARGDLRPPAVPIQFDGEPSVAPGEAQREPTWSGCNKCGHGNDIRVAPSLHSHPATHKDHAEPHPDCLECAVAPSSEPSIPADWRATYEAGKFQPDGWMRFTGAEVMSIFERIGRAEDRIAELEGLLKRFIATGPPVGTFGQMVFDESRAALAAPSGVKP